MFALFSTQSPLGWNHKEVWGSRKFQVEETSRGAYERKKKQTGEPLAAPLNRLVFKHALAEQDERSFYARAVVNHE